MTLVCKYEQVSFFKIILKYNTIKTNIRSKNIYTFILECDTIIK